MSYSFVFFSQKEYNEEHKWYNNSAVVMTTVV